MFKRLLRTDILCSCQMHRRLSHPLAVYANDQWSCLDQGQHSGKGERARGLGQGTGCPFCTELTASEVIPLEM